jgi:hypothetical protein
VTPPTQWRGEFIVEQAGALEIFANDSVLPFWRADYLYTHTTHGDRGNATITVTRVDSRFH